ncbi:hypothetical protein BO94DRAFT_520536 [Aspergillus sclerotioniger CBS 115572]|uniref:Rhodopsin domain-containing protein n=1 Tax=Aspergillus sclerotioniger CBS 115572 TaxID=1450535 RepID=A0A317W770_9EURO|nr:hypothetical protein BO94DRAFT_520536 [Aspergillus sclerotioniger CBS 115572]PWY81735.1 hypothetical protein BO94DRAFT_520536 [Aspergillus sclerotioniger CBS 115572]
MTYTSLPAGVSPPLAEDNERNHAGLVIIFASVCLFLILSSLGMRIYSTSKRSAILSDDYLLTVAVVRSIPQTSVVLYQAHLGWGKSHDLLDAPRIATMEKTAYASDLLYITILGFSKCCTSLFYEHLSTFTSRWTTRSLLVLSVVWTFISILLVAIRCSHNPWEDINHVCGSLLSHWTAITILDIIVEVLLLVYPVKLIYRVHLRRSRKLAVLSILGCRGILIPLAVLHYVSIRKQISSDDPTLIGAYATVIEELHLSISILLLTLSSVKLFLATYEDDDGLAYTNDASRGRSQPRSRSRKTLTFSRATTARPWDNMEEPILYDPNRMIIKDVQIEVTSEVMEMQDRIHSRIIPQGDA